MGRILSLDPKCSFDYQVVQILFYILRFLCFCLFEKNVKKLKNFVTKRISLGIMDRQIRVTRYMGACNELRTVFSLHARTTKRVRKSDVSSISDRSSFRAWPRIHNEVQKGGPSSYPLACDRSRIHSDKYRTLVPLSDIHIWSYFTRSIG